RERFCSGERRVSRRFCSGERRVSRRFCSGERGGSLGRWKGARRPDPVHGEFAPASSGVYVFSGGDQQLRLPKYRDE
uniref:Uncharacterized protein n=1 Tax=Leersia perrieri TaxID=77586 RepID=A0A0D9XJA0_9ORYZ